MKKIKKIGILSLAKIQAFYLGIFGIILSIIYFLAKIFVPEASDIYPRDDFLIFLPLLYALIGFISGAIWAFLYNLISKFTGGVEVEIEK
ncbi:MAG: hypothetical protein KQA41_00190 [Candidatus Aenigmarchaeota archaeon]|nr:hypothetical protein [Candidatus Aenigmarchaeota archaeon]